MLAFNNLVKVVIVSLVILFFVILAPMVPAKANGTIEFVDRWLADHGLDLALIARVNTFSVTPEIDASSLLTAKPSIIQLSWSPNSKADCSDPDNPVDRYEVVDVFSPNPDGSGTIKMRSDGTDPDRDCSDTNNPDCRCILDACTEFCYIPSVINGIPQYGGQHKFTLSMLDVDDKALSTPRTADANYYTAGYLETFKGTIQADCDARATYLLAYNGLFGPRIDVASVECNSEYMIRLVIENTAYNVLHPQNNVPTCTDAVTLMNAALLADFQAIANGFELTSTTCQIYTADYLGFFPDADCSNQMDKLLDVYHQLPIILYSAHSCNTNKDPLTEAEKVTAEGQAIHSYYDATRTLKTYLENKQWTAVSYENEAKIAIDAWRKIVG